MNSYISLVLAAERAKDLQCAAAVSRERKEARQARRAARGLRARQPVAHHHASQAPDSYEDFLGQTAQSARREPTAAGRSRGQAVR
jgi:hypothetical protein